MNYPFTEYFKIAYSLLLPFTLGIAIISMIPGKSRGIYSTPVAAGLAYGIGIGILSYFVFVLNWINKGINVYSHVNALALLILFTTSAIKLSRLRHGNSHASATDNDHKNTALMPCHMNLSDLLFFTAVAIFISLNCCYVIWRSLNIPVYTYDAVCFIAMKAKVLFYGWDIGALKNIGHPSYPLLVPIAEAWTAACLGKWDDQIIKIIFPAVFLSFIVFFGYALRSLSCKKRAALGLLLLCSSPFLTFHATVSYRDLFLLYYSSSSILLIIMWRKESFNSAPAPDGCGGSINERGDSLLILSSLCAGLAAFTKLEGSLYLLLDLFMLSLILKGAKNLNLKRKTIKFFKFLLPSMLLAAPFQLYKMLMKIPAEKITFDLTWRSLDRIPKILAAFLNEMFLTANWNLVWIIFAISLALNFKNLRRNTEARILVIYIASIMVFYFFDGLLTANFEWLGGPGTYTALSRLMLHFFPAVIASIVLLNNDAARY